VDERTLLQVAVHQPGQDCTGPGGVEHLSQVDVRDRRVVVRVPSLQHGSEQDRLGREVVQQTVLREVTRSCDVIERHPSEPALGDQVTSRGEDLVLALLRPEPGPGARRQGRSHAYDGDGVDGAAAVVGGPSPARSPTLLRRGGSAAFLHPLPTKWWVP
jgi:hypothetical protein